MTDDKINIAELAHIGRTGKICEDACRIQNAESGCYCAMVADALLAQAEEIARLTAERDAALAGAVKVGRIPAIFYPEDRTGYEGRDAMQDAHAKIAADALRAFPGAGGDQVVALCMLARQLQSVINGAKQRLRPAFEAAIQPDPEARQAGVAQCCMCGKNGLSTAEDGGPECELHDGRWVCGRDCYDRATEGPDAHQAALAKAWMMACDAAAYECDYHAGWIERTRRNGVYSAEGCLRTSAGNIRALTPPADLAAKIGGE